MKESANRERASKALHKRIPNIVQHAELECYLSPKDKEDMYSVFEMINEDSNDRSLRPEELRESFDNWWPQLEPELARVKSMGTSAKTPIAGQIERFFWRFSTLFDRWRSS